MHKTIVLFIILTCYFILSCSSSERLHYNTLQGFYEYYIIDHKNNQVKDTLFSVIEFEGYKNNNLMQMFDDVLGTVFYTRAKVQKLWDVKNTNEGQFFTLFNSKFKSGYEWSLEREIGFSVGSFERNFKCLNTDSTIELSKQIILKDLTLVQQRDLIDVGGFWEATNYGFDNNHRLVFLSKYIINPRNNKIHEKNDYLILKEFYPIEKFKENDQNEWRSKNSTFSIKWLNEFHGRDDIIDFSEPIN